MTITAAADGSALGNPGPTGWAWYIDAQRWASGGSPHGTNNQGELTAVLELLRATRTVAQEPLVIECDSKYVIDSLTKWMPGWKRNGWRKADKKPVLNRELLEALDAELTGRDVRFTWVKGHAGHPLNEAADERAQAAARAYQNGALPDSGPGFGVPSTGSILENAPISTDSEASDAIEPVFGTPEPDAPGDGLFGDDFFGGESEPMSVTLELTPAEFSRLQARARSAGTSVDEFLKGLI